MNIIRVQSSVHEPLRNIIDDVRVAVSRVCNGIDDMNRFGNNRLVVRAEIYPSKLPTLYAALQSIKIHVSQHALPDVSALKEDVEYPIAVQVTSLADDTGDRVNLPNVPG
jgi:hypothetical protein